MAKKIIYICDVCKKQIDYVPNSFQLPYREPDVDGYVYSEGDKGSEYELCDECKHKAYEILAKGFAFHDTEEDTLVIADKVTENI